MAMHVRHTRVNLISLFRAKGISATNSIGRTPEDLFHFPAFGQFVNQFIQVSDLSGQWGLDLFDAVSADDALYQVGVGVQFGPVKEGLKGDLLID